MDKDLAIIFGEYYNYKSCCIDSFINIDYEDRYWVKSSHSYYGTGFIPCEKCCEEVKDFTISELNSWLGRNDIDRTLRDIKDEYIDTLNVVNSGKFDELCIKYKYDKSQLVIFLEEIINDFK